MEKRRSIDSGVRTGASPAIVRLGGLLLAVVIAVGACDRDATTPPREVVLQATVGPTDPTSTYRMGAVLLSIDGAVEEVESDEAGVLILAEADRTVVALTVAVPARSISFRISPKEGATPSVQVLQVVDGANALNEDPQEFTADVQAEGG